jgi:phage terminase large subunit
MKQMEIVADFKPIIENLFDFQYRYFVYLTGRNGLAKSTNIAKCLLIMGLLKPLRIMCCREHMTSIKDSVHSQLKDIIKEYELPYAIYNDTIRASNGTSFIFRGLREIGVDDIKSFANVNICWIEEGASVSKSSFDALVPTIRAKQSYIIISANPDNESDIVYQEWGPNAERRSDSYTCYKDYRYNPFPLEATILHDITLKKKNRPDDYDRIYLGNLRRTSDRPVVRSWNPDVNVGIGKESKAIYWSLDFNVNPQCSVICHWNGGHDFYFSDEIVLENASTYKVAEEFVNLYRDKYDGRPVIINGDASGANRSSNSEYSNYAIIEQVLTKHHIRFEIQVPRRNTSISNRVNNFDWHVSGVDGKPHILVNPECRHLCHSCKLLSYDENGKIIEIPARFGMKTIDYAKSHIFDAASYCVMINDPVLEDFVKTPKSPTSNLKDMWERSLMKAAGGVA